MNVDVNKGSNAEPTPPDLRTAILKQREMLTAMISRAMRKLSRECVALMHDRAGMEQRLTKALDEIPDCKHLYVMDADGVQIVSNITRHGPDVEHFGRDRSHRPYMQGILGTTNFRLSEAYISRNSKRPSLTAIRVIRDQDNTHVGFLGADYDLRELPATQGLYEESQTWRQIKGDPSIRGNLFQQHRVDSQVDGRLDDVMALMSELMTHHGVFHGKLHFSSSRATIWLIDDPYCYRILSFEDLTDPNTCLAYPHRDYSKRAVVPAEDIPRIFEMFRELRFADENIYLRAGSINICNGMVALNFSCDGSHYIRFDEFLNNGLEFWFGKLG
ncbi:PDC sensor domain-containing protein [Magnetovibrio sp.]|uniref:PDC sensor domain-containing protein n=1 Tax=Magnetovibrio sp. TaxID=2024836 RepID=UPI002F92220F